MTHPTPSYFCDLVLGTDLIRVARLQKAFSRYGQSFFNRLLTNAELNYCFSDTKKEAVSIYRAAGKIALKEATAKALATGLNGLGWTHGVNWHDIEVLSQQNQAPELKLHGKAKNIALEKHIQTWKISLSHDGEYATATVIGLIHF